MNDSQCMNIANIAKLSHWLLLKMSDFQCKCLLKNTWENLTDTVLLTMKPNFWLLECFYILNLCMFSIQGHSLRECLTPAHRRRSAVYTVRRANRESRPPLYVWHTFELSYYSALQRKTQYTPTLKLRKWLLVDFIQIFTLFFFSKSEQSHAKSIC